MNERMRLLTAANTIKPLLQEWRVRISDNLHHPTIPSPDAIFYCMWQSNYVVL